MLQKILWRFLIIVSLITGMYSLIFFFLDDKLGLITQEDNTKFLNSTLLIFAFYTHIATGGIALIIGWTGFSLRVRKNFPNLHEIISDVYVSLSLVSALSSLYISYFVTGGLLSNLGFGCLSIIWFYSSFQSLIEIVKNNVYQYKIWMTYSYACCFAAVSLHIWIPITNFILNDFILAHRIVAWASWIPNLIIASIIVNFNKKDIYL